MAQTKKRRRRKHRGTQGGRIDQRRSGRPRSREEARARARSQTASRGDRPPTWRSATVRGVVAAGLFLVLLLFAFRRPAGDAIFFSLFMLAFYIPAGYYMDSWLWRRRERSRLRGEGK